MQALTIREYTEGYTDAVIDLILGIQRDEFGVPITREDQPDLGDIANFYQTGNGNFWLALHEGALAGTISLKDIGDGEAALRKMFVKAAYRGSPYRAGQQLLDTLLAWARARGVRRIHLGTTDKFLAAHKFYEKNGFVAVAREALPKSFPFVAVDSRFYSLSL